MGVIPLELQTMLPVLVSEVSDSLKTASYFTSSSSEVRQSPLELMSTVPLHNDKQVLRIGRMVTGRLKPMYCENICPSAVNHLSQMDHPCIELCLCHVRQMTNHLS